MKKKKKLSEYLLLGTSIVVVLLAVVSEVKKGNFDIRREENPWEIFENFVNHKIDKITNIEEKRQKNAEQKDMMGQFAMIYVPCSEKEQREGHLMKMAATDETQNEIDVFNEYMQNGSGTQYTRGMGFCELSEGKLTLDNIMENPDEIAYMIKTWKSELSRNHDLKAKEEMYNIYYQLQENKDIE